MNRKGKGMTEKLTRSDQEAGLRKRAEEIVLEKTAQSPENLKAMSPEEILQKLHELQVHQIELEMQNEELRRAQVELNAARTRYFDLYDLAPVGYCTLSEKGLILEANLAAATLLGLARGTLIKQPISRFILKEDQDIYYRHHKQLFETGEPQACEVRMVKMDGMAFWAHLEATAAQDADGAPVFRIVMSDNPERKRMEEALLESEFNIRNMANQLVDVFLATDNSGFVTFASPSALQMFGWKPEEMVGRSFIEFLPESEILSAVAEFKGSLASGQKTQNFSYVMKRKDESTFQGELNRSVIWKDGRTSGTVGIIRDITERKRVEEALRESEERYRNQVEGINDVAYSINRGGEITYISPVVKNLLGYEPDEVTGRHFLEFVHQEDHDLLTEKFSELREGIVSPDTYRMISKDGVIKWVRSQTSPIFDIGGFAGGRGVLVDITEHKQAERVLQREKENFRHSLDESPLGVRIVTIEGETLYANRAILDIYGYGSIEEFRTNPLRKRYTPESYAEFTIRQEKRRQTIDVPPEYTVDIIRKNGEVRHLQVFRKNTMWNNEKQDLVMYMDITERKRSEEEKLILEERLRHADKMEAVGTLAGGLAHDFNNLLTGIQGYAFLTLQDLDHSHPHHERLKRIEEQVQSGANLTRQLLGFARGGRYDVKPTDMNDILEKISSIFKRTSKDISIHREYGKELWSAEVDWGQMEQVFMNLFMNAVQAMPEGGEIHLQTENVLLDDLKAFPHAITPGKYVKLTVADTGTGMDEKIRGRIFDPFFTTKEMGRGTGLGLATVYGIIKGHKGMIHVDSEPGQGATFTIHLPASEKTAVKAKKAAGIILKGTETILLVDDEKMVMEVNKDVLEFLGYRVYTAGSGQKGIAVYMENQKEIKLVILDMLMPGMSGGETFDRLREINPGIKVLLSSGYSINGKAQTIMDRGCNGFLQKPFRMEELSHKVREILD